MGNKTFPLVRGRKLRVTRLDACGRPVYGPCSVIVTEGFISVALTANTNEGDTITVTNANGKTCIQDVPCPEFNGYGVEVTFCNVDPALFALMSGQDPVVDANGDTVGFRMSTDADGCASGYALELWAGVPGAACSTDPNAAGSFGYILLPFVMGGVLGDFTIENAAINFVLTGGQTKDGSGWGIGPYDVVGDPGTPTPLDLPIGPGDALHVQYTEVAPPDDTMGCLPLLDPTDPALTSATAVVASGVATITLVPAGAGDPVWFDWGDGTMTYYPDDTVAITHTYTMPGTYDAIAYRGSSQATITITSTFAATAADPMAGTRDVDA
jgi:hypothetical protein